MKDFIHNGNFYVFKKCPEYIYPEADLCIIDGIWGVVIKPRAPKQSHAERHADWKFYLERKGEVEREDELFRSTIPKESLPTLEALKEDHQRLRSELEASDRWKSLRTHLETERLKGLKLSKIVALGLGSSQTMVKYEFGKKQMEQEVAVVHALMNFLAESNICFYGIFC